MAADGSKQSRRSDRGRKVEFSAMTKPDVDRLGDALVYLRSRRQLTAAEVSNRSQVTRAMLSGYEHNERRPSVGTLAKILGAMDASWGDLDEAQAVVEGEGPPGIRRVSLLSALMGSEESRAAAADALRGVLQFCVVALSELGEDPDEPRRK